VNPNPFWTSRKFSYAAATLLSAVILAALPSVIRLDAATEALLRDLLPGVLAVGIALITGHTITDVVAIWSARPADQTPADAAAALIDLAANGSGKAVH
jgi:hypothetical protein